MTLRLNGSTSGYTEIDAPAVAGSNTLVLPTGNGSDGNILGTDGAGNLSWVGGRMVLETAQASTSGTSIDFTGIPSWVKKITVMFSGVSTSGTSIVQIQIGSGSFQTTGYRGSVDTSATTVNAASVTTGLALERAGGVGAANSRNGAATFMLLGSNIWAGAAQIGYEAGQLSHAACAVTLSGTLDRIRITTVNGTDTFDAGSINILVEG
jgi:hypothetical protein